MKMDPLPVINDTNHRSMTYFPTTKRCAHRGHSNVDTITVVADPAFDADRDKPGGAFLVIIPCINCLLRLEC